MELKNVQTSITQPSINSSNKRNLILVLILTILVLAIGVSLWLFSDIIFTKTDKISTEETIIPESIVSTVSSDTWENYQNQRLKYSIKFPNNWFSLTGDDTVDEYKFFSNENVTTFEELSKDGIWISLRMIDNVDYYKNIFDANVGLVISDDKGATNKLLNLTINGRKAVEYTFEVLDKSSSDYIYVLGYIISEGDKLYSLEFVSVNKDLILKDSDIIDKMAKSFEI